LAKIAEGVVKALVICYFSFVSKIALFKMILFVCEWISLKIICLAMFGFERIVLTLVQTVSWVSKGPEHVIFFRLLFTELK
jgi:hypothetical protein